MPRPPTSNDSPTWLIAPISEPKLTWGATRNGATHSCSHCHILLLTGERQGFCCGPNGNRLDAIPPLPPLPFEFFIFLNDPHISHFSRKLNLLYSFASMESSHTFPSPAPPSFLAIAGRIYHRIRDNRMDNSAIRWILYDGFDDTHRPHETQARSLPPLWIAAVQSALLRVNPLTQRIITLRQSNVDLLTSTASVIIEDSGTQEIAAIISYENTTAAELKPRSLIITLTNSRPQQIPTVSRLWEPLAYPLFFPSGTLGWGVSNELSATQTQTYNSDVPTTQIWHYRAMLLREQRFAIFGRLTNEYVVDMFSRDLECRLHYIRTNQQRIRAAEEDALLMDRNDVNDAENIYLPASFLGSWRWCSNQISDSLAIAAAYGPPTFFITMTCNADWPEIRSQLRPGQNYTDIPVVVCRVFKQKLNKLFQCLRHMFPHAGSLLYILHCIEFQKRGLPHAHILIKYTFDCLQPQDIDNVITARIPDDPSDANIVRKFMLHSNHPSAVISTQPPDAAHPLRYCERWRNNCRVCRFGYPKDLRESTFIDTHGRVHYARPSSGDERVVPHCLPLLRKFLCHLNFELAGSGHLFQYLFKYIHKGDDCT